MTYQEFIQRYPHDPKNVFKYGGQGVIFKSEDLNKNGLAVAIKRGEVREGNDKYSILKEFTLGKTLSHPNLAEYHDVYRIHTELGYFDYGIMEFIENGTNLDDFIKTFPSEKKIREVLRGILEGVKYLHANGVIHRDLKPNNILIKYERGRAVPKIIDFGVSKELSSSATSASAVIGTFEYMAPEQISPLPGQSMQPNTDLWTFGVIVYRMFTGEAPFGSVADGDTTEKIQNNILDARVPEDIQYVMEPYKTLIESCLVRDTQKRLDSVESALEILEGRAVPAPNRDPIPEPVSIPEPAVALGATVVEQEEVVKPKSNSGKKSPPPKRPKSRALPIGIATVLALILSVGGYFFYQDYQARQEAKNDLDRAKDHYLNAEYEQTLAILEEYQNSEYFTPYATYLMGEMYYHGYNGIVDVNYEEAHHYFEDAAAEDIGEAMLHLGDMHTYGHYYEQNASEGNNWYKKARKFLEKEENAEIATAQSALGDLYSNGSGTNRNYNKAIDGYKKAAELGFSYAQTQLGNMYHYGLGASEDHGEAFKWYQESAAKGDPSGEYYMGVCYATGVSVKVDDKEAIDWYRKAAEKGYANAQIEVGNYYYNGSGGLEKSMESAFEWFLKAGEQGNPQGQYNVGYMYRFGRGVDKSLETAFTWYEKSAVQGYARGENAVGYLYDEGIGVKEDDKKAVDWYRKAAYQEFGTGQFNLAYMFENGNGIRMNLDSALYWYEQAQNNGNESAADAVRRIEFIKSLDE